MSRILSSFKASVSATTLLLVTLLSTVVPPTPAALAAGAWDTQFGLAGLADAAPNGIVWDFWVDGADLYVIGEFTQIGGINASHIAKWNGAQWSQVGGANFTNVFGNPAVYTIIEHRGNLVVAGEFTSVNGVPGDVAVWDGASWSTIPGLPLYEGANDDIMSLASDGNLLYIGGRFDEKVVAWDDTTMTALVGSWTGSVSAPVYAIHYFGNNLFVGGIFDSFDGVAMNNVGRWDGNQWNATPPGLEWAVTELFDYNGSVYSGVSASSSAYPNRSVNRWTGSQWVAAVTDNAGNPCSWALHSAVFFNGDIYKTATTFNSATSTPLFGVARWTNGAWDDMDGGVVATGNICINMGALGEYDGRLLVGGGFSAAGGMPATNLAEWTGNGWHTNGPDGRVTALATVGSNVYLGGDFLNVFDVTAPHIAMWDGSTWWPLATGLDGPVSDIQAIGTDIYVAGAFTDAGGSGAAGIARWDGASWHSMGPAPQLGTIEALTTDGTNLYAAGSFLFVGGVFARRVAMWDGASWSPLGDGVLDGTVHALAHDGTTLYAAGDFLQAGTGVIGNAITWNGASWSSMDGGFDAPVYSLTMHMGSLYAGGEMNNANASTFLHNIARWNGNGWEALVDTGVQGVGGPVRALASAGLELFVAGDFTTAGPIAVANVSSWDGNAWSGLDGGTDAPVDDIAASGDNVYAGGAFVTAGGTVSSQFAHWMRTATAADTPALESATLLEPPFPNPFNPTTHLRYQVAGEGRVTLIVYSVDGRRVRTLLDEVQSPAGFRSVTWDGANDSGQQVPSGVYYVRMHASGITRSHKLVLLK